MEMGQDAPEISGTWTFEFVLPASEASNTVHTEQELELSNGAALRISGISLDNQGVSFAVETDSAAYIFTGSGAQAELARAAEPEALFFTVEATLTDGTLVPTGPGRMTRADGLDQWQLDWAAPLDPETVASLAFSDGTETFEVSLHP